MPHSLTESFRFTDSFTLAFLFRLFSQSAHSLTSGLDYVQSTVSVNSICTVALQINQYPIETFCPPGTIGTLGEVVIVAKMVLTTFEFFLRRLLEAVPYGLQNDGHSAVQCGQVRFPEHRCNGIGGQ